MAAAATKAANEDLRDAADELGSVYRLLAAQGDLPLDRWAIPAKLNGQLNLDHRIKTALADLHPAGEEGNVPAGQLGRVADARHFNAHHTVMPKLRAAAAAAAGVTLKKQAGELLDLDRRLGQGDMPDRLHRIAASVARRVGGRFTGSALTASGFVLSAEDYRYAQALRDKPGSQVSEAEYALLLGESLRGRIRSAFNAAFAEPAPGSWKSRKEAIDLWRILSLHPEMQRLLADYAVSAKDGEPLAHRMVAQAVAATGEFDVSLLVQPEHVWRYPPLVSLGVKRLGLDDVYGFPEYAVDIGQVIGRSRVDDVFGAVGLVILLVGVLLTGPLAVTGVALDAALAGVALADLATTGASTGISYLRDREQDLAVVGGAFSSNRIAERRRYGSPLAAAASLLCGIAFVSAGVKLLKSWRARVPGTPPVPTRPPRNGQAARPWSEADTSATAGKAVGNRLGTRARPRSTEGERQVAAGPRWERRPTRPGADQSRLSAVSGGRESPTTTGPTTPRPTTTARPPERSSSATDSTSTLAPRGSSGGAGTTAASASPGGSSVADTSFTVSPRQRRFPTKALTRETERAVGAKLESSTGLKARSKRSQRAKLLREQIAGGSKAAPVTKPVLLKEPVITDPRYPAPDDSLASAKPDYLLMTPNRNEVFEVTMDSRFSIVPQERGLQFRGSAVPSGNPHKQIQVRKTLDYLIRRYPDSAIVYNIQTIGDVPTEVTTILQTELGVARKLLAAEGGKGSVAIVVRAGQTFTIY
jgi:hypothetical protein